MSDALVVIAFLALGYLLFLVELVVPGGILGILGLLSVLYGCYVAFELGFLWGIGSIVTSLLVFALGIRWFLRSRVGKGMLLPAGEVARAWKSNAESWRDLLGAEGVTVTDLRPAGVATIGDARLDVVADNIFLPVGTPVQVVAVEGRRIVVEAVDPVRTIDADEMKSESS